MLRLLLATFGLFVGYHALLVLIPLYMASAGASQLAIGAATGVFMLVAIGGHVAAPAVVSRWGTRSPFVFVLVGTSAAALAHLVTTATPPTLLLSALRGGVYGIGAVVSATAVAHLAPPPRRARALATYGFAAALPGLIGSTVIVYLAEEAGFSIALVAVSVVTLACVPLLLPHRLRPMRDADQDGTVGLVRAAALPVVLIFAGAAMAYGAILTFVPVHLAAAGKPAYPFVLATAFGLAAFRWAGGLVVTRWDARITLGAGLSLGGLALALLSILTPPVAPVAGLIFGAGFGLSGTATHSMLTTSTAWPSLGKANAIFNVAWSGGMGVGAVAFGALTTVIDILASYLLVAGWHVLLGALLAAWLLWPARSGVPRNRRPD